MFSSEDLSVTRLELDLLSWKESGLRVWWKLVSKAAVVDMVLELLLAKLVRISVRGRNQHP
jgi:hypothetical protein